MIILHTDSAKSYKAKLQGVLLQAHTCPKTGKSIQVKAGTQIIDRAWRFLEDRIHISNEPSKVGTATLRAKVRSAQYEYWQMGKDLWAHTGVLCQWFMIKLL